MKSVNEMDVIKWLEDVWNLKEMKKHREAKANENEQ